MNRYPAPAALVKRGITHAVDNLDAGDRPDIARLFVRMFEPEIRRALQQKAEKCAATSGSAPLISE